MAINVVVQTGAAPQSGAEVYEGVTVPASQAAWQTAAATAVSSSGGFIAITKADGTTILVNVARVSAVI